jgi:transposase
MLRPQNIERVYLHRAPVDMRKQINGLAILAQDVLQLDPMSGALFVFINRSRNKLKLLLWERNGFIIWYKRLERDQFHWPKSLQDNIVTLSCEQLNWLIDGYDVWRMQPHKAVHYSVLS